MTYNEEDQLQWSLGAVFNGIPCRTGIPGKQFLLYSWAEITLSSNVLLLGTMIKGEP